MAVSKPHSTIWLLGRCLLPSWASFFACTLTAFCLIVLHLVSISINMGTILPNILDGAWAITYTNTIVQPLATFLNAPLFGDGLVIIIWGVCGLVLYTVLEIIVHSIQAWRTTERDIQFVNERKIVRHPLLGEIFKILLWRLVIGMIAAAVVILLQPYVSEAFHLDYQVALGNITTLELIQSLGFTFVVLSGVIHLLVVFLRLYTLRTRLFGETLY